MSLNIKNEEAHRLAKELAALTGESMTTAVTVALKERIERAQPNPKAGFTEWVRQLTEYTAPLLADLPPSDKIGDLLYDKETGLPLGSI